MSGCRDDPCTRTVKSRNQRIISDFGSACLLSTGSPALPWWGYVVVTLVLTHVTIAAVTIFLHRCQAHRGLDLHPVDLALLPLLAVAHHRHGDQGVGRHPPQAPRESRDRRRPAQPADPWHRDRPACRAPSSTATESTNRETLDKYGHGTPDDWLERNLYARFFVAGRGPDARRRPRAVRADRRDDLGGADDVDPDHRGRHHQRPRPLLGLSQLRRARRVDQHRALGHPDRRRGAAQQSPRLRHIGQAVVAVVRVRHRLALHPHPGRSSGSRQVRKVAPQLRFDPSKAVPDLATLQAVITHRYAVVDELRPFAQGRLRGGDRRAARAAQARQPHARPEPAPRSSAGC